MLLRRPDLLPDCWASDRMQVALITGITGQDGSYLAEQLIAGGVRVVGAVRNVPTASAALPVSLAGKVTLVEWDLLDQSSMQEALSRHRPSALFNFAAYSRGSQMYDDPVSTAEINGLQLPESWKPYGSSIRTFASARHRAARCLASPWRLPSPKHPRSGRAVPTARQSCTPTR